MKRCGATMLLPATLLFLAGGGLAGVVWLKVRPLPRDSRYVGSSACASCHRDIDDAWRASQHTKMMRPAGDAGVLVADFADRSGDRRFELGDVVWAIGGKWEQQFMGHDGNGETLLPGAWMHLSGEWQLTAWDGWQLPIPKDRCHGCHTVGLDAETGTFVEPNIGCESCHGPSSWHTETWGFGRVTSTTDADVCGQCHVRGKDPTGRTFFPTTFRPGDDLAIHFDPELPADGQTSTHWWANGRARDRHQEYTAWSQGGHAASLKSLREGYDGRFGAVSDNCLRCHAAEAILQPWRGVTIAEATEPVTCSVCHNTHGDLAHLRMPCGDCHGGEGSAYYHTPEANPGHVPCPLSAKVGCADCHMPKTAQIGGAYALHSHSPGIVTPRDAARWEMPSSCQNGGCHLGDPIERFDPFFAAAVLANPAPEDRM